MRQYFPLISSDPLTQLIKRKGIYNWNDLVALIYTIPYGRNAKRTAFELVISENQGTCSSKHALLKCIADLNNIPNVTLILGMYKMNAQNTPHVGTILSVYQLDYLPEAHCYLKIENVRVDYTHATATMTAIENDIIQEIEIQPVQVGQFKIAYHRDFLQAWIEENAFAFSLEYLWNIRERCIEALSQKDL
ncbi:MAG: hypothetical protein ACFB0B_06525 [Thermonemataceae bacterium]